MKINSTSKELKKEIPLAKTGGSPSATVAGVKRPAVTDTHELLQQNKKVASEMERHSSLRDRVLRNGLPVEGDPAKATASLALKSGQLASEARGYINQGRPFFFLVDREQKTVMSAREFVKSLAEAEFESRSQRQPAPQIPNLELAYQSPKGAEIVFVGNLARLYADKEKKRFVNCLCRLHSESQAEVVDEDLITNLCIVAACFHAGVVVRKDEQLARALSFPDHPEKRTLGYSIASQVVAESKMGGMLDFCLSQGADPRLESFDDQKNLLDILTENRDFHRLAKLLPGLNRDTDERFLVALLQSPNLATNKSFQSEVEATLSQVRYRV